ncbi:MAG: hypothetical protein ACREBS_05745 [Nitrososphaerales archaeon]
MKEEKDFRYNFNQVFSLETNIPYFEGMFHSFRESQDSSRDGESQENSRSRPLAFRVILDDTLKVSTSGRERVNLMLFHEPQSETIEFLYPWFKPVCAKLEFAKAGFEFTFNKRYLTFSNVVAEGWELIDVFRSLLVIYLIRRGMYMLHAAAIKLNEDGIIFPAFGNTGKTTTSWMLSKDQAEFLTDEFAILDSEGNCFGLPCSSLVSRSSAVRFGLELTRKQSLGLFFNDLKSKLLSTRFAPGGIKIYPDRLFKICRSAKITKLAIIQNGLDSVQSLSPLETVMRIKAIQDYEFGWKANPYVLALSFFTGLDLTALSAKENEFLRNFASRVVRDQYLISSSSGEHYKTILNILGETKVNQPAVS